MELLKMCDKMCGECEWFFESLMGCPFTTQKIIHRPACGKFRSKREVTVGDHIRASSNEQLATAFALTANCEECPARGKECDPEKGTTFAVCRAVWFKFIDSEVGEDAGISSENNFKRLKK